ncbi:MAG TPA: ribulose-phosphate 3-epimerase [Bryobacteraceae bacterium]|jgi:ribulose-phosphate 3-epimerase|nr:ribulose-phosphate 3-epimerase [Bryobacteraceae bacterium]
MLQIVPSILSADFARLAEDVTKMELGGAKMLHVDVMDGHFVPNLTLGPPVVKSLRKVTSLVLDVHLMITDPDKFAPLFIEAGADQVSIHYEAATHLDRTIRMIQSEGAKAGVVLNPATPVSLLEDILYVADFVLVMSVNPGFEAQKFIPNSLNKIRRLNSVRKQQQLGFAIEIDGGVSASNTAEIVKAGCDWLVAGSAVFHSADPSATVKEMQQIADNAAAIMV